MAKFRPFVDSLVFVSIPKPGTKPRDLGTQPRYPGTQPSYRYAYPPLLNWWIPTFILQSTEISNGLSSDGGGDGPGTVLVEVNNLSPNILLILLIILYP